MDSDHNPILLRLKSGAIESEVETEKEMHKVNWKKFSEEVTEYAQDVEDFDDLSIESKSRTIQNYIRRAMKRVTTIGSHNRFLPKERPDSKLLELRDERR